MHTLRGNSRSRFAVVLVGVLLGSSLQAISGQTKPAKPAAASAKRAAPAKPVASATKPGGNAAGASAPKGPSTSGTGTAPPMANGSGTAAKPSTTAPKAANAPTASAGPSRTAASRAPAGSKTVTARNGATVTTRRDGRVADLHDAKRGMDIHHGLDGGRRVSVERRDGSRLVVERGRPGYVQRGYNYHGHDFARRSYYFHDREYDRFYRGYGYRGMALNVYAPGVYFAPAFYGWAYNPWAVPIAFGWGWGGNPWLGFYGGYFTPFPVYPSAAFWLTDYLIAQDLQAAYAARVASDVGAASPNMPPSLNLCEQGGCGTLTWDGAEYNGTFNNGAVAILSVVRWDSEAIVLSRRDPPGVSAGNTATYTGKITGPNSMGGSIVGVYNGGSWAETWNATSPIPILQAATAPPPSPPAANGPPALTPQVKQLIADEVKNQLALENAEATQTAQNQDVDAGSSGIARIVDDVARGKSHMFVVGGGLDVTDASSGQECHLSDGDALQLTTPLAQGATAANVAVKASKGGVECAPGSTVAVSLTDLQEMQNHMRENIDLGLRELQANQGKDGLPPVPASAQAAPAEPQYAALAPPPNPKDAADIQAQSKQADQAESEAQSNP